MNKLMLAFFIFFFSVVYCNADFVKVFAENDIVADTDRDYTHGTRVTYGCEYTNSLFFLPGDTKTLEWSLTQLMYTPLDKETVELQEDDRPYAGYIGVGVNVVSLYNYKTQFESGFAVGMTGPYAFAKETQTQIHEWSGSVIPMGWDNQIDTELILNAHYGVNYKLVYGKYFDVISRSEVALGNMLTYIDTGLMFRLGYNLERNFGINRIEPSIRDRETKRILDKIYFYTYAYPQGRYVARNIFLDGNTFSDSHSVGKEPLVGDFSWGAAVGYGLWEMAYSYVYRSKEFKSQEEHNEFVSLSISVMF